MKQLEPIWIIYNPNSTGNGKKNAEKLQRQLRKQHIKARLHATEHPGHGLELAEMFARRYPNGMIISSSGDGGYHEVINGVLSANPKVVTGVLPSGNANDHHRFMHHGNLPDRIAAVDIDTIDVLKVVTADWTRYAHSYAGIGITPQIGKQLTKHDLNPFNEAWLVIKHLFKSRAVTIRVGSRQRSYDHLVWSTIGSMSKIITLSETADVHDGKFELTMVQRGRLSQLLRQLLWASSPLKNPPTPKMSHYEFTPLHKMSMQLDGEVYSLPPGKKVIVTCEKQLLRCIV